MGQSKHDKVAGKIARAKGADYNRGQGPDVVTPHQAIEVAVRPQDIKGSLRQLQGFDKPRYIATSSDMVSEAKEVTKGTGVGVMGPTGHIHKRARRGKS